MGLPQRFWDKVEFAEDGCWLWLASKRPNGYGQFKWGETIRYAHRVSYSVLVGPIPKELVIDHLCRVRHCVNPDHMELVTFLENVQRGERPTRTHCKWGHPFDKENTYLEINKKGHRGRHCRACDRDRKLKARDLQKERFQ